jgi:hypothetical protein
MRTSAKQGDSRNIFYYSSVRFGIDNATTTYRELKSINQYGWVSI